MPWDPNADGVQDEVFQNSQLNDMMEKYQENNINRDIFYEEQREKVKAAREEALKKKKRTTGTKTLDAVEDVEKKLIVEKGAEQVVEGVKEQVVVVEGVEEVVDEC